MRAPLLLLLTAFLTALILRQPQPPSAASDDPLALGNYLFNKGRFADAAAQFDKAIAQNPKELFGGACLTVTRYTLHDPRWFEAWKKTILTNPKDPIAKLLADFAIRVPFLFEAEGVLEVPLEERAAHYALKVGIPFRTDFGATTKGEWHQIERFVANHPDEADAHLLAAVLSQQLAARADFDEQVAEAIQKELSKLRELEEAVRAKPEDIGLRLMLASECHQVASLLRFRSERGKLPRNFEEEKRLLAKADEQYRAVLRCNPNDREALVGITGWSFDSKHDQAFVRRLLETYPDSAIAHFLAALATILHHDDEREQTLLHKAAQLAPRWALPHRQMAKRVFSFDKLKPEERQARVADSLRRALARDPKDVATLNDLAAIAWEAERYDEALHLLERALTMPSLEPVSLALSSKIVHPEPLFAFPKGILRERVVAVLRRGIKAHPDDPHLWEELAWNLRKLGQLQEAIAAYHRAVSLPGWMRPDLKARAQIALAKLYEKHGNLNEALRHLELAAAIAPRSEALIYLALLCRRMGKIKQAEEIERQAMLLHSPVVVAGFFYKTEPRKAIELLSRVEDHKRLGPVGERHYVALKALAYDNMGEKEKAAEEFVEMVRHLAAWPEQLCQGCHQNLSNPEPKKPTTFPVREWWAGRRLRELWQELNKLPEVTAQYEAQVKEEPDNTTAKLLLAYAYQAQRQEEKAKAIWREIEWVELPDRKRLRRLPFRFPLDGPPGEPPPSVD